MISFRIPVRFDDTFIFKEIENVLTELELERDRSERESLNFQRMTIVPSINCGRHS